MTSIGPASATGILKPSMAKTLLELRSQFDSLQNQLATGKKSQDFAGLGDGRTLSLSLRARLSDTQTYRTTIQSVGLRLNLAATSATQIKELGDKVKGDADPANFSITQYNQTSSQHAAKLYFDQAVELLNANIDGRYLFSGGATDVRPVTDSSKILEGFGVQAGLKQIVSERQAADLGQKLTLDDLMRVNHPIPRVATGTATVITTPADGVKITTNPAYPNAWSFTHAGYEDASLLPTTAPIGVATEPDGSRTFNITGTVNAGDTVSFWAADATGNYRVVTLTATASAPPAAGEFTIGATDADTVASIEAATAGVLSQPAVIGTTVAGDGGTTVTIPDNTAIGDGDVFSLRIPDADGNYRTVTLTARAGAPAAGEFQIGANAAATAANVQAAITAALATPEPISVSVSADGTSAQFTIPDNTAIAAGDTVSFRMSYANGSYRVITLTATASATPGEGEFTIGPDAATTAANLQAAAADAIEFDNTIAISTPADSSVDLKIVDARSSDPSISVKLATNGHDLDVTVAGDPSTAPPSTLSMDIEMPDGTVKKMTFTAVAGAPANPGEFLVVPGDEEATARNLRDAILGEFAATTQSALSGGRLDLQRGTTADPAGDTGFTLSHDTAGSHPFGFRLTGVASTIAGLTITPPTVGPTTTSLEFDMGAQPNVGDYLSIVVSMPDGTEEAIKLTASATGTDPGTFKIGATLKETTENLRAALGSSVGLAAASKLRAASAMAASENFFSGTDPRLAVTNPDRAPLRITADGAGLPFDGATAFQLGTPDDTVVWYNGQNPGDDPSSPARSSVTARVDQTMTVGYGARANEAGMRATLQTIAVYASVTFDPNDAQAANFHAELASKVKTALAGGPGKPTAETTVIDLSIVQAEVQEADDRHKQSIATMNAALSSVEGINDEEVSAKILALQTRLEASYQTTSILAQLSLVNYL